MLHNLKEFALDKPVQSVGNVTIDSTDNGIVIYEGSFDPLNDSVLLQLTKNIIPPIPFGTFIIANHTQIGEYYARIFRFNAYPDISSPEVGNLQTIAGLKGKPNYYSFGIQDAEHDSVTVSTLQLRVSTKLFHPNYLAYCPQIGYAVSQPFTAAQQAYIKGALRDSFQALGYYPGYSAAQPYGLSSGFSLSTSNPSLVYTPADTGAFFLAFRLTEYRDGQKLGDVMYYRLAYVRDSNAALPKISAPYAISGAPFDTVNQAFRLCPGQYLQYTVKATSTLQSAQIVASGNMASPAGSTVTYTGQNTDSATATFSWTPASTDGGYYYLYLDAVDTACGPNHFPLHQSRGIRIFVQTGVRIAGPARPLCKGRSVTLHAIGAGQHLWTAAPGGDNSPIPCPTCDSITVSPYVTTTYIVSVTGAPCVIRDSFKVVVIPDFTIQAGRDTSFCKLPFPGSFPLSVSVSPNAGVNPAPAAYTYLWQPGPPYLSSATAAATTVLTPSQNRDYTISVSDTFGCFTHTDTVRIRAYSGQHSLSPKRDTLCPGEQVQLTATGGNSYVWMPVTGLSCTDCAAPVATPLVTTAYAVVIRDTASGCTYRDTAVIVTYPAPAADAGPSVIATGGPFILQGSGNGTYSWSPGAYLEDSTVAVARGRVAQTTIFTLTVRSGPCIGKDTVTVFYTPCISINMPNAFAPGGTGGRSGHFIWTNTEPIECLGFVVYNRWGQKVWEQMGGTTKGWDGTLNGAPAQQGVYVYMLKVKCPATGNIFIAHGNVTLVR